MATSNVFAKASQSAKQAQAKTLNSVEKKAAAPKTAKPAAKKAVPWGDDKIKAFNCRIPARLHHIMRLDYKQSINAKIVSLLEREYAEELAALAEEYPDD